MIRERLALQCQPHDREALLEAIVRLGHGDIERFVFQRRVAAAKADMQRRIGQQAEHGDLLGHAERLVPGRDQHRGAEPEAGTPRGDMDSSRSGLGVG